MKNVKTDVQKEVGKLTFTFFTCFTVMTLVAIGTGSTVWAEQAPVDSAAIAKIRDEGLNRSKVSEPFDMLTKWGISKAHLEPWEFGRGWELEKLTIEMVELRYMPLTGYAEAWTPSTPGEMILPAATQPAIVLQAEHYHTTSWRDSSHRACP